jgi:hypothetical protein
MKGGDKNNSLILNSPPHSGRPDAGIEVDQSQQLPMPNEEESNDEALEQLVDSEL